MHKKKWRGQMMLTAVLFLAVGLAGCTKTAGNQTTADAGLGDLGEIIVVSREEGSGTRAVFAEGLGFTDSSTGRDKTTEGAVVADNTQKVLEAVAGNPSAVGYVSAAALKQETADVHTVTVDGKNLERNFYLTYSGKLSELETDFLSYVQGAGQKIVAEYAQPVDKETSFLSMKPKGTLRIGGSTSVAGMMKELADTYMKINSNADIEVVETDSTNGLTGAMDGTYDLGMSSRDLKDYEKELLEETVIARDEIQVIVNKDNPLTNVTSQDLKKIYTGQTLEWKELDAAAGN
ncbi:MAG: substrate-binding domain-containing protein [Agathobacter sp.]